MEEKKTIHIYPTLPTAPKIDDYYTSQINSYIKDLNELRESTKFKIDKNKKRANIKGNVSLFCQSVGGSMAIAGVAIDLTIIGLPVGVIISGIGGGIGMVGLGIEMIKKNESKKINKCIDVLDEINKNVSKFYLVVGKSLMDKVISEKEFENINRMYLDVLGKVNKRCKINVDNMVKKKEQMEFLQTVKKTLKN